MNKPSPIDRLRAVLLPRERFTIRTHLQQHEVMQRVKEVTQPYRVFLFPNFDRTKPYFGEISHSVFSLRRFIRFGKSGLLPWIDGKVRAKDGKTIVEMVIELEPLARYTLLFFYGALGLAALFMAGKTLVDFIDQPGSLGTLIIVLGILIVPLVVFPAMVKVQVGIEAARSKRFFRRLLEDDRTE